MFTCVFTWAAGRGAEARASDQVALLHLALPDRLGWRSPLAAAG